PELPDCGARWGLVDLSAAGGTIAKVILWSESKADLPGLTCALAKPTPFRKGHRRVQIPSTQMVELRRFSAINR
ncbi:MAG: hypothetical protein WA688_02425, partial [Thermoplasmata archaeon]